MHDIKVQPLTNLAMQHAYENENDFQAIGFTYMSFAAVSNFSRSSTLRDIALNQLNTLCIVILCVQFSDK